MGMGSGVWQRVSGYLPIEAKRVRVSLSGGLRRRHRTAEHVDDRASRTSNGEFAILELQLHRLEVALAASLALYAPREGCYETIALY
jgi:hypothetical protein